MCIRDRSISNRALIMKALAGNAVISLDHLSNSKDTQLMNSLIQSSDTVLDAGAAGTTFRFLTAFLAISTKEVILTGSERMKQRPIGELVDTLNTMGANIEYLEKSGYPPLKFHPVDLNLLSRKVSIKSTISSQYISACLLYTSKNKMVRSIRLLSQIKSQGHGQYRYTKFWWLCSYCRGGGLYRRYCR